MLTEKLIASIKHCIHVDFEHVQYRLVGPGLGIGTSVWDALDDALFNLAETRHGALSDIAENEHVVAAFEQLMQDYAQSQNQTIGYRVYWTSERPTEFDVEAETIDCDRVLNFDIEERDGILTFDATIWDASDLPEQIPEMVKEGITDVINNSEHYFYIDLDEQEIRNLLADYEDDLAAQ